MGIGMVHQHFMLADNLTVLENVILGSEPTTMRRQDRLRRRPRPPERGRRAYGLDVDPDELVETLEVGERQRIEIIKVLYRGAKILILDEPTAVLVPQEVEALFDNLRELKASGSTILFIDHKLLEVLEIADAITVLRAGQTVATVKPEDVTPRRSRRADGRQRAADARHHRVDGHRPRSRLSVSGSDVSSEERPGRCVENASLTDPPRRDRRHRRRRGQRPGRADRRDHRHRPTDDAGTITLIGDDITRWHGARAPRGAASATSRRTAQPKGCCCSSPLWENAALGHQTQRPFSKGWWIDRKGATPAHRGDPRGVRRQDARRRRLRLRLSGGNQQKLIIGREMTRRPEGADRRPPDARHRRRRPGRGVAVDPRRPLGRAWRRC